MQYWAVTSPKSDLADKVVYNHSSALERISENSTHFASKIEDILTEYNQETGEQGILVAPYDAELFGHWWFEGVLFLKDVLRQISSSDNVELTCLSEHLKRSETKDIISIPEGSWGQGNHHYIWLNEQNEWT